MAALGMICEWNPFHLGHAWLLRELKRCYSLPVVCVMSGNFVQRGEPAVAEKRARAEMALRCGADVVFELPTVWAMASAERFARGGVALLRRTGVVTQVAFGSECGDAAALMRVAACLDGEDFRAALQRRLAGTVGTEVEADDAVIVGNRALAVADDGLDELIRDARVIGA